MDNIAPQERPRIHFTRGPHRFEIFQRSSPDGVCYLGFYDGQLSIAAGDRHAVTQMMLRRHSPPDRSISQKRLEVKMAQTHVAPDRL